MPVLRQAGQRRLRAQAAGWIGAGAVAAGAIAGCPGAAPQPVTPRQVAVTYIHDIFAGRYQAAAQYVLPSDRGGYRALTEHAAAAHWRSVDIRAAAVRTGGSSATVVFTGQVCPEHGTCLTNKDPDSTNPVFRVHLARSGQRWFVAFTPLTAGSPR